MLVSRSTACPSSLCNIVVTVVMSTRRTTRSTKQQGQTQAEHITSHFRQKKAGGSELPGKALGDDTPSTTSAKRTLFSASRVEVIPNEVEIETVSVQMQKSETKSRPVRALFGAVPKKEQKVKIEVKEEPTKEEVKEKVNEPIRSIIPTEADIVDHKPTASRKLGSVDLQADLVKKGGATKIHEQIAARKLEQIAEREAFLKSPQKMIKTTIIGGSPPKRAKRDKKREPVKVLPTPDYVLPGKSMEKGTKRAEREKTEEREASPEEDSMTRAPKGYGSSLMCEEVKMAARILLPSQYSLLHETFKFCDQIVSRCEGKTLTFTQLSRDVKRLSRRELPLDLFAQLLAVYPQAYRVKIKQLTCVGDRMGGSRTARWEHVIKPNLDEDITSFVTGPILSEQPLPSEPMLTSSPRKNLFSPMKGRPVISSSGIRIPASPRKPSSPAKPILREVTMDPSKRLEGWRMNCRQQVFRCLLTRLVIEAHEKFIRELNLDSSVLPPSSSFLPRFFHDEFTRKIDSICPTIVKSEMAQIPEEANAAGNSHKGMGDFIKIAADTVAVLPKSVDEALLELRSPEKKTVSSRGVPLSPAKFAQVQSSKPMTVLERIKAKKAAEAAAKMRSNPELEEKLADLRRLIDNKLVSLIFSIFQSNSKTAMDTTKLAERMADSGKVTKEMVASLLLRLSSLLPTHFSINQSSLGKFIKIMPDNSSATFTTVESLLKNELEVCLRQSSAGSLRFP